MGLGAGFGKASRDSSGRPELRIRVLRGDPGVLRMASGAEGGRDQTLQRSVEWRRGRGAPNDPLTRVGTCRRSRCTGASLSC